MGKCPVCKRDVYSNDDQFKADGEAFHRNCFKCEHCKRQLTLSNFAAVSGTYYCKTHFLELFHSSGGKYSVFGGDKFRMSGDYSGVLDGVGEAGAAAAPSKAQPKPKTKSQAKPQAEEKEKKKKQATSSLKGRTLVRPSEPVVVLSAGSSTFSAAADCRSDSSLSDDAGRRGGGAGGAGGADAGKYMSLKDRLKQYEKAASKSNEEGDEDYDSAEHSTESKEVLGEFDDEEEEEGGEHEEDAPKPKQQQQEKKQSVALPSKLPSKLSQAPIQEETDDSEEEEDADDENDEEEIQQRIAAATPPKPQVHARKHVSASLSASTSASAADSDDDDDVDDDVASLRGKLAAAKARGRKAEMRADALHAELSHTRSELSHAKGELAVQVAKALESDEWCAKLSLDLESMKKAAELNN